VNPQEVKEAIFGSEPRDPDAEREDHRMRHSSFATQVITGNKDEARLSFAALGAQDQQNDVACHEIPWKLLQLRALLHSRAFRAEDAPRADPYYTRAHSS
jgi:hypothetical protein